jgi:uncharacterized membrane protein
MKKGSSAMKKASKSRASQWFIWLGFCVALFGLILEILRAFGYRELHNKLHWNYVYNIVPFALMIIGMFLGARAKRGRHEESYSHIAEE